MFTNLKKRYGVIGPVAILALIVAVAFAGVPAVAQPVGNSSANAFKLIKRALKLGAVANKRSVNAIKIARATSKQQGPAGADGAKGDKGDKGDDGAQGPTGPQGPAGLSVTGVDIPQGPAEDCGIPGGVAYTLDGVTTDVCNGENGSPGSPGTNGKSVLSGSGSPEGNVTGSDGDFYIDTDTHDIYGPKTGAGDTGWGTEVALKGPKGDTGDPWTAGGTLPPGATITGNVKVHASLSDTVVLGGANVIRVPVSFPIPLTGNLSIGALKWESAPECSGNEVNPQPDPGFLCFYEDVGMANAQILNTSFPGSGDGRVGGNYVFEITADNALVSGGWGYRAPLPAP